MGGRAIIFFTLAFQALAAAGISDAAGTYSQSSHVDGGGRPSKCDCDYRGETIRILPDGRFTRETQRGRLTPVIQGETGTCEMTAHNSAPSRIPESKLRCCVTTSACHMFRLRIKSLRREDSTEWFQRWPDVQGK